MAHEEAANQPEIAIGDPRVWITLYEAQGEAEQALAAVRERHSTLLEELAAATGGLTVARLGVEIDDNYANESDEVWQAIAQGEDVLLRYQAATAEGLAAAKKLQPLYAAAGGRAYAFGDSIRHVPPRAYVTRAIGSYQPALDYPWTRVRGEIEIFRQLTGETRPDVTLGPGLPAELWAVRLRANITLNVHRVQLTRIMLSFEPKDTAREFGKEAVLERCGSPPNLSDEEVAAQIASDNGWAEMALRICEELEPFQQGLRIDNEPDAG